MRRRGVLFIAAIILSVTWSVVASVHPAQAYSPDLQGAHDWANWYCVHSPYGDYAIADYMWFTNPGNGSLSFNVTNGGNQDIKVNLNLNVAYCQGWPYDTSAYAYNLQVGEPLDPNHLDKGIKQNLLTNAPGFQDANPYQSDPYHNQWAPNAINYGPRIMPYTSEYWPSYNSAYTTGASLNLTGYKTGDYEFCTWFTTYSAYKAVGSQSPSSCATVHITRIYPPNFNLSPSVNVPQTSAVEPGSTIAPLSGTVTNKGSTSSFNNTAWQLSRFVVAPGGTPPGSGTGADPCTYYGNGCKNLASGKQIFPVGATTVGQNTTDMVTDAPAGAHMCYALSVNGFDQDHDPNNQALSKIWLNSTPVCIVIGKKPKVQILGGDLATRGGINTGVTQKTNGVFGSWVEYGAFSVLANQGLASESGLSTEAQPQQANTQASWSKLTFANSLPGQAGNFTAGSSTFRPFPNAGQYFSSLTSTIANNGGSCSGNVGQDTFSTGSAVQVCHAGNLTLSGGTLNAGQSAVIVASGDVAINGNLTYANGPYTSLTQLPQLVIIAKNIYIADTVSNIDAWLVTYDPVANATTGTVNTCAVIGGVFDPTAKAALSSTTCSTPLVIHGPVIAGQLYLRRTGGSGANGASGDPAETIDLRADTYLWAQLIAAGAGRAQTDTTTELPPRF